MSTPLVLRYPLDPTGISPDNLIVDEVHTVPNRATRAVAPRNGPFYTESLRVFDAISNVELVSGRDFHAVEYYEIPSRKFGKEVCAIVLLVRPNQSQDVRLEYQAVGGEFSYSIDAVVRMIESLNLDDRPVHYPDIIDLPPSFTPAPHMHDIGDTYGWEYIVQALENLRNAVLMGDSASHDEIYSYIDRMDEGLDGLIDDVVADLNTHINDTNNPHQTTKAQVGLGSVQNYPIATKAQAEAGTANNAYLTPLRGLELINSTIGTQLNDHLIDQNNPHGVTKAQVGLGSVQNYPIATTAQAEAGTSTTVYMTADSVRRAIDALIRPDLNAHVNNKTNPHAVTKAQVGLGSVQNYAIASQAQAEAADSNNVYMTPLRVRNTIDAIVRPDLAAHINNKENPHGVTKAQVGLGLVQNFAIATTAEDQAATSTTAYVTPAGVRRTIDAIIRPDLTAHVNDKTNPHAVTKSQVGLALVQNYPVATVAEDQAGTATNRYSTPAGVRRTIDAVIRPDLDLHIAARNNPHQTNKTHVGLGNVENYLIATQAQAQAGTINTAYMTPVRTAEAINSLIRPALNTHIADTANPHQTTKEQVGLGNIPNAITNERWSNTAGSLLTAKGMYDHVNSGDHDGRYVRLNAAESGSIRIVGSTAQVNVGGSWRQFYPPLWT